MHTVHFRPPIGMRSVPCRSHYRSSGSASARRNGKVMPRFPPVLAGALTVCRLPAHHAVVQWNPELPLHRHDDRCRLPAFVAPRLQGLACWRNAARLAVFGTGRSGTDRRARLVHAGAPTASGAAASRRRVGSPHLRRDWAHVCCICIGTGLGPILRRFEARGILGREGAHGWPPA